MSKRLLLVFMVIALLLAACAQAEPDEPVATATLAEIEQATQPVDAGSPARCFADSREATPDPTAEALLPPITVADWSTGPDDAHVSIIEYGDFQ